MNRWVGVAAVNGMIAVAMGAFAAHGLRATLTPEALQTLETAVRYHMYHALVLGICGLAPRDGGPIRAASWAFIAGIVLFCGSLYALALSGVRGIAIVTPFGGASFLVGWLALAWAGFRRNDDRNKVDGAGRS